MYSQVTLAAVSVTSKRESRLRYYDEFVLLVNGIIIYFYLGGGGEIRWTIIYLYPLEGAKYLSSVTAKKSGSFVVFTGDHLLYTHGLGSSASVNGYPTLQCFNHAEGPATIKNLIIF